MGMTNEEEMMAAIKYIEDNSGVYRGTVAEFADLTFIELAKKLAKTLKAKLIKVEDGFGEEDGLKCYRFGTGIVNVIHPEGL
jgi:hypothetical protein